MLYLKFELFFLVFILDKLKIRVIFGLWYSWLCDKAFGHRGLGIVLRSLGSLMPFFGTVGDGAGQIAFLSPHVARLYQLTIVLCTSCRAIWAEAGTRVSDVKKAPLVKSCEFSGSRSVFKKKAPGKTLSQGCRLLSMRGEAEAGE